MIKWTILVVMFLNFWTFRDWLFSIIFLLTIGNCLSKIIIWWHTLCNQEHWPFIFHSASLFLSEFLLTSGTHYVALTATSQQHSKIGIVSRNIKREQLCGLESMACGLLSLWFTAKLSTNSKCVLCLLNHPKVSLFFFNLYPFFRFLSSVTTQNLHVLIFSTQQPFKDSKRGIMKIW